MTHAPTPLFDALTESPTPERLYHYTSARGLEGILRNRRAWATAARYLNDAQEVRYALGMARARLARAYRQARSSARRAMVAQLARGLDGIDSAHPFVCIFSLSQRADDLSQWRAYGPKSGGYSLGFRSEGLRDLARRQRCVLAPCVYERAMQRALIAEAVDPVVRALARVRAAGGGPAASLGPWMRVLRRRVQRVAPLIKWPDYEAEAEWRVIWAAPRGSLEQLRFRASESLFVPFVEIRLDDDGTSPPIEEIHVGPGPTQAKAAASLRHLLRSLGLSVRTVRRSRIPLRSA